MTTSTSIEDTTVESSVSVGTLADSEIVRLAKAGELITHNFSEGSVKQACYELRASEVYYEPPDGQSKTAQNGRIVIRPRHLVVVITEETIALPNNMLGRILSKGQLFSVGLVPVNTYADPGFSGRLGIVLQNVSDNYIKISPGDCIAKLEFSRLELPVSAPYDGQHGYQTKLWPFQSDNVLNPDEVKAYKKLENIDSVVDEIRWIYGGRLDEVMQRIFRFERTLLITAMAFLSCTATLIGLSLGTSIAVHTASISIGVVGSLIASVILWYATKVRRD